MKIKTFLGTNENPVLTQIWVAMCYYLLLAYLKCQTKYKNSLYYLRKLIRGALLERLTLIDLPNLTERRANKIRDGTVPYYTGFAAEGQLLSEQNGDRGLLFAMVEGDSFLRFPPWSLCKSFSEWVVDRMINPSASSSTSFAHHDMNFRFDDGQARSVAPARAERRIENSMDFWHRSN